MAEFFHIYNNFAESELGLIILDESNTMNGDKVQEFWANEHNFTLEYVLPTLTFL